MDRMPGIIEWGGGAGKVKYKVYIFLKKQIIGNIIFYEFKILIFSKVRNIINGTGYKVV